MVPDSAIYIGGAAVTLIVIGGILAAGLTLGATSSSELKTPDGIGLGLYPAGPYPAWLGGDVPLEETLLSKENGGASRGPHRFFCRLKERWKRKPHPD